MNSIEEDSNAGDPDHGSSSAAEYQALVPSADIEQKPEVSAKLGDRPPEQQDDRLMNGRIDHLVTFRAYEAHEEAITQRFQTLFARIGETEPRLLHDPEHRLLMTGEEAGRLYALYPENARERAVRAEVHAEPPKWFARTTTETGMPQFTQDPAEALSPTSFALASTNHHETETGAYYLSVSMLEIPESSGFSREARHIAQMKAYVHELAHTITNFEIYFRPNNLRFVERDGTQVDPFDYVQRFFEAAINHPPISNYSSAYRDENGEFHLSDDLNSPDEDKREQAMVDLELAIDEELAESITAYLLGFVVTPDGEISFEPLADRPDVEQAVIAYLNAKRIALPPRGEREQES